MSHSDDDGEDVDDYDNTGDVKLNKDEKFYLILWHNERQWGQRLRSILRLRTAKLWSMNCATNYCEIHRKLLWNALQIIVKFPAILVRLTS